MNSISQFFRSVFRRLGEGPYSVGSTHSRFIARDVKREIQIVENSRLSEGYITVKIKTSNLLYEAGGLVSKSEFGPPTEVAIDELWQWKGHSWGGLPDKTSIVGTHLLDGSVESRRFNRHLADKVRREWPRMALFAIAPLVFLIFPLGVAILFMSGKQLIWEFDDMPLFAMFLGFVVGGGIALPAMTFVIRRGKQGELRRAWVITLIAAIFDCAAVPVASRIIDRVEHREAARFSEFSEDS